MKNLFYQFEIGESEELKQIQIERITPGEVLSLMFKLMQIWNKGGDVHNLLENYILKGLKINNVEATTEDLQIYEYIDLLVEAVEKQIDFESLGKSKTLKKMGFSIDSLQEKFNTLVTETTEKKSEEQEEN